MRKQPGCTCDCSANCDTTWILSYLDLFNVQQSFFLSFFLTISIHSQFLAQPPWWPWLLFFCEAMPQTEFPAHPLLFSNARTGTPQFWIKAITVRARQPEDRKTCLGWVCRWWYLFCVDCDIKAAKPQLHQKQQSFTGEQHGNAHWEHKGVCCISVMFCIRNVTLSFPLA